MRHKEPQVDKEIAAKVEDFRKSVDADAEDVIFRIFPSKKLIKSTSSTSSPFHQSHAAKSTDVTVHPPPNVSSSNGEPDQKKRKREAGAGDINDQVLSDTQHGRFPNLFHENKHLVSVHQTLKKECEQLIELTDKVKLWINLTMPNGDNFEVLNELHRSQESGYNIRDSSRQHHLNRAKICSKIIKYPHLEDYALALKEHDDKQLYIARQNLSDLRNVYAVITDIVHKNINKLRTPKGNNGVGLY
ncbi:proteasome activator pa28 REG alpha/beta subunit [Russula compacta]|nr:proteasome activator pa28 REG alpha/beta subunit [Russula compacta]